MPTGLLPAFRGELPVMRAPGLSRSTPTPLDETPGATQSFNDVPAANPFYYRPFAHTTRGQVSKVAAQRFFPHAGAPAPPATATP